MAITKIHQIKTSVTNSIKYITDPTKTDDFLLTSGYNCNENTAYLEFEITENLAKNVHGDFSKIGGSDIKAHHMIQSFSLEDSRKITPEQAHEIGKKWVDELLQGKYEYVIATHIDKGHTHNHVIFNATSFYDLKKFNSVPYKTVAKLREVSDKLCMENNLDVIKKSQNKGKSYHEWDMRKQGKSWKAQIENIIDKAISKSNNYETFIQILKDNKVEIKNAYSIQGKYISFKLEGQDRFTRGKTIGNKYEREAIIIRIAEPKTRIVNKEAKEEIKTFNSYDKKIEWEAHNTKTKDTKELAEALITIRKENINEYLDFDMRVNNLLTSSSEMKTTMKNLDDKNTQYKNAAKYLVAYNDYFKYYQEYESRNILIKQKYKNKFNSELEAFDFAVKKLSEMNINVNVDPNKVLNLVSEQNHNVLDITNKLKTLDNRINKIRNARSIVDEIQGNKEQVIKKSKEKDL